jgi:hypothetical protein
MPPEKAAVEMTFTIAGDALRSRYGTADCMRRTGARRFTAHASSSSSRVTSGNSRRTRTAALFTSTSRPPSAATARSTRGAHSSATAKSAGRTWTPVG